MESLGIWTRVLRDPWSVPRRVVSHHPRTLTTVVILGLAGFAATAFGIAPMAPDSADLPLSRITEVVPASGIERQIEILAEHDLSLYRSDFTRPSDTADSLLRRLNVSDPAASAFLRADPVARKLLDGRSGKMVQAQANSAGTLGSMVARYAAPAGDQSNTHFTRLNVVRVNGKFEANVEILPLIAQQRTASATIRSSLFAATDEARIPDALASQLAEIFATDIDFHRELRRGDTFSVIYESMTADGEAINWNVSAGRVVAAEFVNKGRKFSALWFKDEQGRGAYYALDGKSRTKSFLVSPLEFSRTTSGFAMRMHPILNQWKQHNGVDYAAPKGTPVRAVGEGVVEFAGQQNGYGNIVQIKHAKDRATVYAHLSSIDVRLGQQVEQGQSIGAVGATGWATGPHLHFEFKVAGIHQDPTTMTRGSESLAISPKSKVEFETWAQGVKAPLEVAQLTARTGQYSE